MNRLLAVFSHPDDETFRPGGTLALLAQSGVQVHVLTATRGEAGSCGDPPLCTSEDLPGVRERELRCACAALGLQPPRLLGYEDGNLQKVDAKKIIAHILSAVDEVEPQVLLGFGPDGLSGHPDHIVIGRHTLAAMHCHATQWSSSPMMNAREEHMRFFFEREYFVRAASRDIDTDFMPGISQEHLL